MSDRVASWHARLSQPGWMLLPQRLFLGVTFSYAGLQKLSDPKYLDATNPASVQAQMRLFRHTSPIGPLLGIAVQHATFVGVLIALTELAVGLGTLIGLWARFAAGAGAMLALTFLLTVSWHTHPYYYGSDIVFIFLWLPLIAVGAAGVLSTDAWLATRRAGGPRFGRRTVLHHAGVGGALAVTGMLAASAASWHRTRSAGGKQAAGAPAGGGTGSSASPGATGSLVRASAVPVGGAVLVNDPQTGGPVQVVQPSAGVFRAFSAICTHAGCTVNWSQAQHGFVCPCHGATYDAKGQVTGGPAPSSLTALAVKEQNGSVVRTT